MAQRRQEADAFYAELTPPGRAADEATVMRQAFAGMLWSKQLYAYDVARWLEGDPTQPTPPAARNGGRNAHWTSFDAFDVMSMPDKWEYPWFAAWDLAFHCVALAHLDPAFAKYQLLLLCREWFQHPSGALPPTSGTSATSTPRAGLGGARGVRHRRRPGPRLPQPGVRQAAGELHLVGEPRGRRRLQPVRRRVPGAGQHRPDRPVPSPGRWPARAVRRHRLDGLLRALHGRHRLDPEPPGRRPTLDLVLKFLEHFAQIRQAMATQGVWDGADGFYYDKLVGPDGRAVPVKVRSMVGVIPLVAAVVIDEEAIGRAETVGKAFARLLREVGGPGSLAAQGLVRGEPGDRRVLLGVVGVEHLTKLLAKLFDEREFLSPYGLRALSAFHRDHPYELEVDGFRASIDYEPAESTTGMFGGNSNWRGPIWFPLNYLLISALERYHRFFGDELTVEYPTGGPRRTLDQVAADLRRRLVDLFVVGPDGRRPCFGGRPPPARPRLERQPGLQRVLPRRRRGRARRLAPDGVDGPGGRPHPRAAVGRRRLRHRGPGRVVDRARP